MRRISLLVIAAALVTSSSSLWAAEKSIQIKGSDTMVNLTQAWAEEFMMEHPDAMIAVTGGGSGTGIAALISGTCDIAQSSRSMKEQEIKQAKTKGIEPKEYKVGLDGLAVVVHASNPVDKLTIDQVADIFTGKIRNWKELGGHDLPIVILSREVNSGTHVYFKEHVLRKGNSKSTIEFDPGSLMMASSQSISDEIAQNPNAVGYYGMGYVSKTQKAVAIAVSAGSEYVAPTIDNVLSDKYYISRPLLLYTNGEPQGMIKEFIDFVFSPKGQVLVKETDFVPVK